MIRSLWSLITEKTPTSVIYIFVTIASVAFTANALANNGSDAKPSVGKKAAQKFFTPDVKRSIATTGSQFLAIHFSQTTSSTSYVWGNEKKNEGIGKSGFGFTYLAGQWSGAMDFSIRAEYNTYEVDNEKPTKLSVVPLYTFPQVSTGFPIYFGIGAGLGVYFKQINGESNLSFDYQLLMGIRVLNAFDTSGFFIEGGLKNHLHILSDGQYNSSFVSAGMVFTF